MTATVSGDRDGARALVYGERRPLVCPVVDAVAGVPVATRPVNPPPLLASAVVVPDDVANGQAS